MDTLDGATVRMLLDADESRFTELDVFCTEPHILARLDGPACLGFIDWCPLEDGTIMHLYLLVGHDEYVPVYTWPAPRDGNVSLHIEAEESAISSLTRAGHPHRG